MKTCAVLNCRNSNRKPKDDTGQPMRVFKCPQDPAMREKWERACGRPRSELTEPFIVCLDHFTEEDWDLKSRMLGIDVRKSRLKDDAVPSQNIPDCALPTPKEQRLNKREHAKIIKQALTEYEKKKQNEISLQAALEIESAPIAEVLTPDGEDEVFVVEYVAKTQVGGWRSWCGLCAKCPNQETGENFPQLPPSDRLLLEALLVGSLSVQDSPRICVDCQKMVSGLRLYQENCVKAQELFYQIQERNLEDVGDLHDIRLKFGLDAPFKIVQQETIIFPQKQPENAPKRLPKPPKPPKPAKLPKPRRRLKLPPTYPCSMCGDRFDRKKDRVDHMREQHNIAEEYICDVCGKIFNHSSNLASHRRTHLKERSWCCEQCPKRFKTSTILKKHVTVHHDSKTYVCPEPGCGIHLRNRLTFDSHKKVHENLLSFKCPACDAAFNLGKELKNHLLGHLGYKRYKCPFCAYGTATATSFVRHTNKVHPDLVEEYKAAGRTISRGPPIPTMRELEATVAEMVSNGHTEPLVFRKRTFSGICRYCGETFADNAALFRHRRAQHTNKTNFACKNCDETFDSRMHWQLHQHSHATGQRHKCTYCFKTFVSTNKMWQHANVCRYRNRPLTCTEPDCDVKLRTHAAWKAHTRSHLIKKPHKCNGCVASYDYTDVLKSHILTFHYNYKRYHCAFCDFRAASHTHFVLHAKKNHPDLVAQYEAEGRKINVGPPMPRLAVMQERVQTLEPLFDD